MSNSHSNSHISYYIKEHLHWLPISTRIEYKVFLIVLKAQMGVAPKYLCDVIRLPTSATSLRPLRSMERQELFVPWARTVSRQLVYGHFVYDTSSTDISFTDISSIVTFVAEIEAGVMNRKLYQ